MSRHRSRSPQGVKLHVSNLPVGFPQAQLINLFERFGKVGKVRIIRNGPKGYPLRKSCYAFVQMPDAAQANLAMRELSSQGWSVSYSNHTRQKKTWSGFVLRGGQRVAVTAEVLRGDTPSVRDLDLSKLVDFSNLPGESPRAVLALEGFGDVGKGMLETPNEQIYVLRGGGRGLPVVKDDQLVVGIWESERPQGLNQLKKLLETKDLFKPVSTFLQ